MQCIFYAFKNRKTAQLKVLEGLNVLVLVSQLHVVISDRGLRVVSN